MSGFNNLIAEYRSNFHKIYYSEVLPIFENFEKTRKQRLLNLVIIETVLIVAAFFLIRQTFQGDPDFAPVWFIPGICVIVCCTWLPFKFHGDFVKELKNVCIRRVLNAFGDIHWAPKTDIVKDNQLRQSDLFSVYNLRSSDDAFYGSYKGVNFNICETKLLYESGSGKRRTVHSVFNGVVINFEANKNIKNKTIIATKGDMNIKNNNYIMWTLIVGTVLQCCSDIRSIWLYLSVGLVLIIVAFIINKAINKNDEVLNEIKLEDPEFNKKYKAYSSDEIEGRYLITPAFMERFNNVKTAFGATKIKCSFYDSYLMFAITSNKNLFEIGSLFSSLKNPKQMKDFFEELVSILVLVDYFKLDEKTGI